jgi:hypothetical protein
MVISTCAWLGPPVDRIAGNDMVPDRTILYELRHTFASIFDVPLPWRNRHNPG